MALFFALFRGAEGGMLRAKRKRAVEDIARREGRML